MKKYTNKNLKFVNYISGEILQSGRTPDYFDQVEHVTGNLYRAYSNGEEFLYVGEEIEEPPMKKYTNKNLKFTHFISSCLCEKYPTTSQPDDYDTVENITGNLYLASSPTTKYVFVGEPIKEESKDIPQPPSTPPDTTQGMDIRTHIATELLKGILSYNPITYGVKMNVSSAVLHTDLLLKELAKTKP